VVGSCEHTSKPLGSIKSGEFLDQLNEYHVLKKDSNPWNWLAVMKNVFVYFENSSPSRKEIRYITLAK